MDQNGVRSPSFFDTKGFKAISVGRRLRELRVEKGFSIKSLAEKSGLAVNTLSLIENQKSSPSVNTLEQLAIALEIPLSLFFEPIEKEKQLIFTRASQRRKTVIHGVHVEDCGLNLQGQVLQPLVVTIPAGQESGSMQIVHTGHEFIYCLSGEIIYTVDNKPHKIKQGDSLLFEAHLPHRCKNTSSSSAVYLLIMMPGDKNEIPGELHFPE